MMRTLDQVDAEPIYRKAECSARELRDYLQLDFVIPVNAWAKRPKCQAQTDSLCKELYGDTIGRGFSLTVFGCVCHRCLYPRAQQLFVRANVPTAKPTARGKRNRWDNYIRPTHNCECGKPISDYRGKHCISCAAKQREAKRRGDMERGNSIDYIETGKGVARVQKETPARGGGGTLKTE